MTKYSQWSPLSAFEVVLEKFTNWEILSSNRILMSLDLYLKPPVDPVDDPLPEVACTIHWQRLPEVEKLWARKHFAPPLTINLLDPAKATWTTSLRAWWTCRCRFLHLWIVQAAIITQWPIVGNQQSTSSVWKRLYFLTEVHQGWEGASWPTNTKSISPRNLTSANWKNSSTWWL